MDITAKNGKRVKRIAGAGIMACKKALVETDGNQEANRSFFIKKERRSYCSKEIR